MTRAKKLAALLTMVVAMGGAGPAAQAQSVVVESHDVSEAATPIVAVSAARAPLSGHREWTYVAARR